MTDTTNLTCPHCKSTLAVDLAAGVVVHHEPPPDTREKVDFEQRVQQLKLEQEQASDRMSEALRREKDRSRLMDDRFSELMKGAAEKDDGSRPVREIDLD